MFQRTESEYGEAAVVVFGGRHFNEEAVIFRYLDKFHSKYNFDFVIAGGATGVDKLAIKWAKSRKINYKEEPADWSNLNAKPCKVKEGKNGNVYNSLAGYNRNQSMLNVYRPKYAIAFPGGTGTDDMVRRVKIAMAFGIVEKFITVSRRKK